MRGWGFSKWCWAGAALMLVGCSFGNRDEQESLQMTGAEDSTGEGGESGDTAAKLDVAGADTGPTVPPTCYVADDLNGVGDCDQEAPPGSFDPDVQWEWGGTNRSVSVTPLVANLTDDDGNGSIDLCDVPDVIVVASAGLAGAEIVVLDGATGAEQFTAELPVALLVTPAIGDIDNDGIPEIVSATPGDNRLIAFEHDGSHKWTSETPWVNDQGGAIGIANLDASGPPEIYADGFIANSGGVVQFQAPAQTGWLPLQHSTASVAADLDDDGDMELIVGQAAYHHDGTLYYHDETILPGYPQVANFDDDPEPEILINNQSGITMLEHDGSHKYFAQRPNGDPEGFASWFRPSTVHDFDGDELAEFAVSSATHYGVFERNLTVKWSANVQDGSGWATGTAFDFLGDGTAEAMYGDEVFMFIFDGDGVPELQVPRSSSTLIEYPIVADVDNDGSAEIVVPSNPGLDDAPQTAPAIQVIRDAEDRWIQARRIWNQHTYHVTNVREDGTIPEVEVKSWRELNTYRTNAQIAEDGSVCAPPPEE